MESKRNNSRRDFIKQSMLATAGITVVPGLILGSDGTLSITEEAAQIISGGQTGVKNVAFLTTTYPVAAHANSIGTKLFVGIPTDDDMVAPQIKIVSVWIDQIGPKDIGVRMAKMNGAAVYPTIEEALTLGGDKLAVDAVIYVGEQGKYKNNRLGQLMYPRMNHLEQIFRVFDASNKSVPLFNDKHLSYNWLDCKWIYDRAKELNVPMMAGSNNVTKWRDPYLEHSLGTKITEAVAIGFSYLDDYGIHVAELLQCMIERRAGGETGVASVHGLKGNDVWAAMDSGKISQKLVDAACNKMTTRYPGSLRNLVKMPYAIIVQYNDGTKGAILMFNGYSNRGWAYAADADSKTVATEIVSGTSPIVAQFSYQVLNIQKLILTGKSPAPIERTLLTSGIVDMGIRSLAEGKVKMTPFLDIKYSAEGFEPIRPKNLRPTGASIGPWPPRGYEFVVNPPAVKK